VPMTRLSPAGTAAAQCASEATDVGLAPLVGAEEGAALVVVAEGVELECAVGVEPPQAANVSHRPSRAARTRTR
jgi:hypothetical protein